MAYTKITKDMAIIAALDDEPNDVGGLSASDLKDKFDEGGKAIKDSFNNLVDELDASAAGTSATKAEVDELHGAGAVKADFEKLHAVESTAANIDDAVTKKHEHSNKALLDTYTQTEADIADAISKEHTHSNKSLLDSYDQANANIADAVTKKHSHSNKALLDSYTQTEADIADAISKKHTHSNKALLDTYDQTNANLSDAVAKKHEHSNKSVLDGITSQKVTEWDAKQDALPTIVNDRFLHTNATTGALEWAATSGATDAGAVHYTADIGKTDSEKAQARENIGAASKPDLGTISISTSWTGSSSPYTQTVTVTGATVTANSKVDIQPSATLIAQMVEDGCTALYIENNAGTLTLYAVGAGLTVAQSNVQVTVTEVT